MRTIVKSNKNTWNREDNIDLFIKLVTFLLSPFLSFLCSLRRINTKSSFVVFFLFALIYGLCFTVVADNESLIETADAARWRFRFEYLELRTWEDYYTYCYQYFKFAGVEIRDLFFGTVTFIVHQFTDNYHVFFFVVSLVFSFFQLKSFRFLCSSPSFDNSLICLLISLLFCYNSIANIGGVRYFTAAWMCVYGVLQIYYNSKKLYIVLLLALPLIHRGFFFIYPIILLVTYIKSEKIWKIVYFFSFALSGISIYILQDATSYLPPFLAYMIEAYTEETIVESYSFTKLFLSSLSQIYINLLFIVMMYKRTGMIPLNQERLYKFTLVFLTIVNFVMPIPSLGGRFMIICYSFIALLWLNIMGTKSKYNVLIYLMPLFMVRAVYMLLHTFTKFQDPSFFYTNPFDLIYTYLYNI